MSKISRHAVLASALDLLNEGGIDALSTRRLAQRLGVESPALYWHFRNKAELLSAMSAEINAKWQSIPLPDDPSTWRVWFAGNAHGFRRSLLAFRDGARLHAGVRPSRNDLARLAAKVAFLESAGFAREHALMALYASSQFTLGCVLEEQARIAQTILFAEPEDSGWLSDAVQETTQHGADRTFEFGLQLLLDGLRAHHLGQ